MKDIPTPAQLIRENEQLKQEMSSRQQEAHELAKKEILAERDFLKAKEVEVSKLLLDDIKGNAQKTLMEGRTADLGCQYKLAKVGKDACKSALELCKSKASMNQTAINWLIIEYKNG